MISDFEMDRRSHVKKIVQNDEVSYLVIVDGNVIFTSQSKNAAYSRLNSERERLSIEEALYDSGLKQRPEVLRAKRDDAKRHVTIKNPNYTKDFPIAWKVYYGAVLIGAYQSSWEAEQFKKKVILEGGY